MVAGSDRDSVFPGNQIQDRTICQQELNITNTPEDGQFIKINMPSGTFTAVDEPVGSGSTFKQTFVNSDLTADKIIITHNLATSHPVVVVYDNSENIILPTEVTYLTDNTIELDLSGIAPITGTYKVRVIGTGGTTGAFLQTFTDADLTAGVLTANHNLSTQYIFVRIYDNNDKIIEADEYTATSDNILTVDLTTFGTLTDSWNIVISTGGSGSGSGSGDSISDADNDTKVEVEKNSDEDIIRFTAFGTQEAQIDVNGLKLKTGADVNKFSTDGLLAGNSDDALPTEKAVKTYVDTEVAGAGGASIFRQTFTNADLSSGLLSVTHNLGIQYLNVTVYDENNKKVMPDDITGSTINLTIIDLTSFGTIVGTWNIILMG